MKVAILMVVAFALPTAPVLASGITTAASAPTTNVQIGQTTISSYSNPEGSPFEAIRKTANLSSSWREVGQTFTVESAFTLDKISLLVSQSDTLPAPGNTTTPSQTAGLSLSMNVWSAASVTAHMGTSLSGFPDTGITPTFPTHPSTPAPESAMVWMTFDVANVQLTPGIYGFTVGFDTPDFVLEYQLGSSSTDVGGIYLNRNGNPYTGGHMFRFHPVTGIAVPAGNVNNGLYNTDLAFIIQSAPAMLHPGDFNADGNVDGVDFAAWQSNFPKASEALLSEGDADGDGDVDGADFVVWQTNFPYPPSEAVGAVPEPTGLALASIALLALGFARLRR
jgi:hypothetical protein